jgi:hypothetical protein
MARIVELFAHIGGIGRRKDKNDDNVRWHGFLYNSIKCLK